MTVPPAVRPIARAWLTAGGGVGRTTGAPNYDEFADEAEITRIIAANPTSALAVEMPHLAPGAVGGLSECLPAAVARLAADKAAGRYVPVDDAVALYRITEPDGGTAHGLWCMVETSEISAAADEPGRVIRNEDVFPDKVRERVALAEATGHLLSPVLLLQTGSGDELEEALAAAVSAAGVPTAVDLAAGGRRHEVWTVGSGPLRDRLLDLAGRGELVVADGNHRSLAAQIAGLSRFLAVVTTPRSVVIRPYHRLVIEAPRPLEALVAALTEAGARVASLDPDRIGTSAERGTIDLYGRDGAWSVTLPPDPHADPVSNLDHALVERRLLGDVLGLDPGDKRVTYVGGDYPPAWLRQEVDAGRAEFAILVPPVSVSDFVAVNLARRKMPRKSTWFTPKARAGLVVAELAAEGKATV